MRTSRACKAAFAALTLASSLTRNAQANETTVESADEGASRLRQMATCDAAAKIPILAASIFIVARGLGDGFSQSLLRTPQEERFYLVTAATASFAHVACGPVIHASAGDYRTASASLGLRAGLPAIAFAMTYGAHQAFAKTGEQFGKSDVSLAFGSVSVGAAILAGFALDYVWLIKPSATAVRPALLPTSHGIVFGVGGTL